MHEIFLGDSVRVLAVQPAAQDVDVADPARAELVERLVAATTPEVLPRIRHRRTDASARSATTARRTSGIGLDQPQLAPERLALPLPEPALPVRAQMHPPLRAANAEAALHVSHCQPPCAAHATP